MKRNESIYTRYFKSTTIWIVFNAIPTLTIVMLLQWGLTTCQSKLHKQAAIDPPKEDTRALMFAIMGVESSFARDHRDGKSGEIGYMQIKECVIDDLNNLAGKNYTYDDRYDIETAWQIAEDYMDLWATEERLGRKPTIQDRARIFHGGVNGWKNPNTIPWWNKVDNYYAKLKIQ